jgi:hypothetical protein
VAGCQPQESCHVADSPPRTQYGSRHDGVINPRPVHDGRGSGSSNEGHGGPSSRAAQFSKTTSAGSTGLAASTLCCGHEKRPLVVRGPIWGRHVASRGWTPRYEAALFVIRSKSDRGV